MLRLQRMALARTVRRGVFQWRIALIPNFNALQRRDITIHQLQSQKDNRERVVILGSGWAGFTLARDLDPKKYQVVVVSPRSYFVSKLMGKRVDLNQVVLTELCIKCFST
jgi:NADH dehydrogenase